jgi:hypothetical protein
MINNFENIDKEIVNLDNDGNLDIFSIENLLVQNIENYKKELHKHVEDVLQNKINENNIIIKKNKNGEIVDIIYGTKEKKN